MTLEELQAENKRLTTLNKDLTSKLQAASKQVSEFEGLREQLGKERAQRLKADLDRGFEKSGFNQAMRKLLVDSYSNKIEFSDDGVPIQFKRGENDTMNLFGDEPLQTVFADALKEYGEPKEDVKKDEKRPALDIEASLIASMSDAELAKRYNA